MSQLGCLKETTMQQFNYFHNLFCFFVFESIVFSRGNIKVKNRIFREEMRCYLNQRIDVPDECFSFKPIAAN